MHIGFLPVDLARWDQARPADLLAVPLYSDVRPLRGASGLLDWRLCGRLSSWLLSGKVCGDVDEQTLFPSGGRVAWRLILAVGLGRRGAFSDQILRGAVHRVLNTMGGLKLTRVAMVLPGRDGEPAIEARRALDLAIAETEEGQRGVLEELTLIEPPAAQKEMADVIRQRIARK